jgi:glyoxylase-like metal-dependent hydrolase (beta-lactamase superfamily II)
MFLNRRQFVVASWAALAASPLRELRAFTQAPGQTPPATPKFAQLRGGVGIFTARGGTIGYLVAPDAVIVVDSQYPDTAPSCLEGLKARSPRPIDRLFNTHHHADHTGGNAVFRPAVARIVAHARVPELQKAAAAQAGTEAQQVYPDATFTDTWAEPIGRHTVEARYYGPAHTGGDCTVTFQAANVVHMGDLVFHHVHPRVDRPAGASIVNWVTVLEQATRRDPGDTVYIFGHGGPHVGVTGRKADVLFFRDYLSAALDFVRKRLNAGASREEVIKANELAGFTDFVPLGGRLTASHVLEMAFEELSAR